MSDEKKSTEVDSDEVKSEDYEADKSSESSDDENDCSVPLSDAKGNTSPSITDQLRKANEGLKRYFQASSSSNDLSSATIFSSDSSNQKQKVAEWLRNAKLMKVKVATEHCHQASLNSKDLPKIVNRKRKAASVDNYLATKRNRPKTFGSNDRASPGSILSPSVSNKKRYIAEWVRNAIVMKEKVSTETCHLAGSFSKDPSPAKE